MRNDTALAGRGGSLDLCAYVRGAAALLRARGVPVSRHAVGEVAHLARSFVREGMGRFEALHAAAVLAVRRH